MISDIVLTGILKETFNKNFRYVETNGSDAFDPSRNIVSKIPVLFWTRDDNNPLMNAKENVFVVIKGRLESTDEMGLYVLCETIHITKEEKK